MVSPRCVDNFEQHFENYVLINKNSNSGNILLPLVVTTQKIDLIYLDFPWFPDFRIWSIAKTKTMTRRKSTESFPYHKIQIVNR